MLYDEYLKCAKKHLLACQKILDLYNNQELSENVLLELYYLSGYIIEGIVVYSAYKLNNWRREKDIQRCHDWRFTRETGIDFFNLRRDPNTKEIIVPDELKNRNPKLCIEGHNFQNIVNLVLKDKGPFADERFPYIGNGEIDETVKFLIDRWKPVIRYTYSTTQYPLSQDTIKKLINTCGIIYSNISYI